MHGRRKLGAVNLTIQKRVNEQNNFGRQKGDKIAITTPDFKNRARMIFKFANLFRFPIRRRRSIRMLDDLP